MLLQGLYTIEDSTQVDHKITARIKLDPNHPIFEGHFPQQPVLPGVCTTQIGINILNKLLSTHFQLKDGKQFKFLEVVDPNQSEYLDFEITYDYLNTSTVKTSIIASKEQKVCFKFKGILS
ncbi:MAG: hypothetical protein MK212_08735 [Saprospiraceae bacterium]|nr:hypothetical protein [Saprospiraceae bacterium]